MGEDLENIFIEAYADDITICHWGTSGEDIEEKHMITMERLEQYFEELHLHLSHD